MNVQPELRKSAQHLGPNQDMLGEQDFGVLGEAFLGTHGFEDFERQHRDELHDLGVEPGLDAADQDAQVTRHELARKTDTRADDDGMATVAHDYSGEYDSNNPPDDGTDAKPPVQPDDLPVAEQVQRAMDLIMQGADIDEVLGGADEELEEEYARRMKGVFPMWRPD